MKPFSLTNTGSVVVGKGGIALTHEYPRAFSHDGFWGRFKPGVSKSSYVQIIPDPADHSVVLRLEADAEEARTVVLPVNNVRYLCLRLSSADRLSVARGASVATMSAVAWWLDAAKARILGDPCLPLPVPGTAQYLLRTSGRKERRALRKDLKILDMFDLGPKPLRNDTEADSAFSSADISGKRSTYPPMGLRIGVVVHLHYTDVWCDIEESLRHIPRSFGLIVTLTETNSVLEDAIRNAFPYVDIRIVPNCGRDVRPFIALLEEGSLDKFDIVCKLHGKKSVRDGRTTALGDRWRRSALYDLVSGPGRLAEALTRFENDPDLGMLGPERLRIPNDRFSLHDAWSGNRGQTLRIAERLNLPAADKLDFFAGTMFWLRPAALSPLRGAGLGDPETYAPEAGQTDGAVEHAIERLFATSARAAGFTLGGLSPLPAALFAVS